MSLIRLLAIILFLSLSSLSLAGADGDGVPDGTDNCPNVVNSDQLDTDSDGLGDSCDADDDGDGVADSSDAFPLDASETIDTDADGTGNNADTDDDGDGYSDAFENLAGTDPLDPADYTSRNGFINARTHSISADPDASAVQVKVQRLFAEAGEASVQYRLIEGPGAKAGSTYVDQSGSLNWANGDSQDKVITIEFIPTKPANRGAFFVELYDPSPGSSLMNSRTQIYLDQYPQDKRFADWAGEIFVAESLPTFGEGTTQEILVERRGSSLGQMSANYDIRGCSTNINEELSSPRLGELVWEDGDADPKAINLVFDENDSRMDRRLDCTFKLYLSNVSPVQTSVDIGVLEGGGKEYLVYNNDFTRPIVHAAQAMISVMESMGEIDLNLVRRGPPNKVSEVVVEDSINQTGYGGYYLRGINGVHYSLPEAEQTLVWEEGDVSLKSVTLTLQDDAYQERDVLISLETSGDDYDVYKRLVLYAGDDEEIHLAADSDGDGVEDRFDPDMDNDGVDDWWDLDADGDGYELNDDSHPADPNQWLDSDYDGISDERDWKKDDGVEQFDTDDDGVGDNADNDDDNDGVIDDVDNCRLTSNADQLNTDGDAAGNACDDDDDNDGESDDVDNCPLISNAVQLNTDGDAVGNACDDDDDNDGVLDTADAFSLISLGSLTDTDGDGRPNDCDSDCTALGMTADTDDDNDGVLDTADGYALISLGALLDTDSDGFPNECDEDCLATGMTADSDDDNDGVEDTSDAFPLDASETADSDSDGVGDNSDAFPNDATESVDSDSDSVGDNADNCPSLSNSDQLNTDGDAKGDACDSDDDNDGFSDEEEAIDGTNPKSRFSCKSGCFSFDVDENLEAKALTDGLLVIRHLFGFSGESLTAGAVSAEANRDASEAIAGYLTDAVSELDIDGDGESKPLTDGLLLIRYLFGFSGDSLISGAIGNGATRNTAEAVEAYIKERVPAL